MPESLILLYGTALLKVSSCCMVRLPWKSHLTVWYGSPESLILLYGTAPLKVSSYCMVRLDCFNLSNEQYIHHSIRPETYMNIIISFFRRLGHLAIPWVKQCLWATHRLLKQNVPISCLWCGLNCNWGFLAGSHWCNAVKKKDVLSLFPCRLLHLLLCAVSRDAVQKKTFTKWINSHLMKVCIVTQYLRYNFFSRFQQDYPLLIRCIGGVSKSVRSVNSIASTIFLLRMERILRKGEKGPIPQGQGFPGTPRTICAC